MLISPFVTLILTAVMALLAMAFFTLLERKILGYVQLRKGPNKVGLAGIPQPLADALKLFLKEMTRPTFANSLPYLCAPLLGLFLAILLWSLYPHSSPSYHITFGLLLFLAISSMNVYTTLVAGWASNSKYALLGALRGAAQTISYEVSMSLIMLCPLIVLLSLNMNSMFNHHYTPLIIMLPALLFTWFTTALAETNRTPFDFAEGESELVSGFNTEYSGGPFAAIFMAEYMNILFMSLVTALLFCSSPMPPVFKDLIFIFWVSIFAILFLWARGTLPRMRYDRLMSLTWKGFLPFSLGALTIILNFMSNLYWYCAGWTDNSDDVKHGISSPMPVITMALWGQLGFQDAASPIMSMLIGLHDHAMLILTFVITFVGYAMFSLMRQSLSCRNILEAQSVETVWTILPAVALLFIALPSLRLLYLMDEVSEPQITMKAIGHQWYWTYQYSDFDNDVQIDSYMVPTEDLVPGQFRLLEVDNRAVLPINMEIRVLVTAADVIHSWAVPSLGAKVDAIPGRLNQVGLTISRPGIYYGQCSEICGANHSFMPIVIEAVDYSSFINWITKEGECPASFIKPKEDPNKFVWKPSPMDRIFGWWNPLHVDPKTRPS